MNVSSIFIGRRKEVQQLLGVYALRQNVLIVAPEGIGKTALLRQVREFSSILICDDSSSLRRISESLERQLGHTRNKLNVIERKNHLLRVLEQRGQPVAFDHVAHTGPRVARFIAHLSEKIPIWIACRSYRPDEVGRIWPKFYYFARVELLPLTEIETRMLIDETVAQRKTPANARAHSGELYRLSGGSPRILTELLMQLAAREYKIDSSHGLNLLDLDRRIQQIELLLKPTAEAQE